MHLLVIFIDGVGLGLCQPDSNPFVKFHTSFFAEQFPQPFSRELGSFISSDLALVPLDASLGIAGLPQSATGQTALFTGINAAQAVGRHIQGFPGPQLGSIITGHGIMKQVLAEGMTATFANMYSPDYLALVAKRKRRHSVSTMLSLTAGLSLRSLPEMEEGMAVYQDITNEALPSFGVTGVDVISPALAARRLLTIARQHHFTLFEYFQTDRAGHKQDWVFAQKVIYILDEFLSEIQRGISSDVTVLITSDHGNFENLSLKTHTYNPVPLLALGQNAGNIAGQIGEMTDITPVILSTLKGWRQSG